MTCKILSIDPGNEQSAYACYKNGEFLEFAIVQNETMLHIINQYDADRIIIERMECMGMAVGRSVLDTCVWIGRYIQKAGSPVYTIGRRDVKLHMCGSVRAKDSNVRQAVMDRYGSTRQKAIGTKKNPGPLYGASKDIWSAMAIALTASESESGLEYHAKSC